ncbi:hypothetical protein MKY34_17345 [Sporosarcina sp. FSL K6-1522]|uniref:hypothetical protein n=1 Tax=Sporosarcina sp. FSL K6-1522 TaxID=2921554 RepID=UPI003159D44A
MATNKGKQAETHNGGGVWWDGWLNSVQTMEGLQQEMENQSLHMFDHQKTLLQSSRKALSNLEKASSTVAEVVQPYSELDKMKDIHDQVQAFSWNSGHALLDLFAQSQQQMTDTMQETLVLQQKGRTEALKTLETITAQIKDFQKGLLVAQ